MTELFDINKTAHFNNYEVVLQELYSKINAGCSILEINGRHLLSEQWQYFIVKIKQRSLLAFFAKKEDYELAFGEEPESFFQFYAAFAIYATNYSEPQYCLP